MASNVEKRSAAIAVSTVYASGTSIPYYQRPLAMANSVSIVDIHPAESSAISGHLCNLVSQIPQVSNNYMTLHCLQISV